MGLLPHFVDCILSIRFAAFNQWQSDVWVEGEFVESSGFLCLNDVVAPINVWMGTLDS